MLGRFAVCAASLIALSACAGMEPAGRNARAPDSVQPTAASGSRTVASTPVPTYTAPPPATVAATPPPTAVAALPPPVATTTASAPQTRATPDPDDDGAVVRGQIERQVRPPAGDPRSTAERMQDINSWDRCVTHVQAAYERDPMRPQLQSPEEYCAQSLGMTNREAIPESRTQRR